MKITKTQLRQIIKEELEGSMGQKVYLVTAGNEAMPIGIFSTKEEAQQGILKDVEYEHQEMGDTTVTEKDYRIQEFVLGRGRK